LVAKAAATASEAASAAAKATVAAAATAATAVAAVAAKAKAVASAAAAAKEEVINAKVSPRYLPADPRKPQVCSIIHSIDLYNFFRLCILRLILSYSHE